MLKPENRDSLSFNEQFRQNPGARLAAYDAINAQPVDLTQAAENSLHAVVHIKSTQQAKEQTVTVRDPFAEIFGDIFGNGGRQQRRYRPSRVSASVPVSSFPKTVTSSPIIT